MALDKKLKNELTEYLKQCGAPEPPRLRLQLFDRRASKAAQAAEPELMCRASPIEEIGTLIDSRDESFSEMLLRKIDELGMKDSDCYKRANVDRKLFSKIRGDRLYRPSKPTAVAFALALRLSREETDELLKKAGFALSHSSKFDIIIEFFISRRTYDVMLVNEALYEFDQPLLGG